MTFRVLDLYAGEGGAGQGFIDGGATMLVGVDTGNFASRYVGGYLRADVLSLTVSFIRQFDYVHASPGCQFATELNSDKARHPNLIPATRRLLDEAGVPYDIENVRAAKKHLINPVSLTGTMFDLHLVTSKGQRFDISRERLFETSWPLVQPWIPEPDFPIANVFGGHLRARSGEYRTGGNTGRTVDFPGEDRPALARQLMGMPWATMGGMSEAVPPAYTAYLAEQFLAWRAEGGRAAA